MALRFGGHRLLRYAATGGTAAIVDLGGLALLHGMGLSLAVAGTASFMFAVLVNFSLSSRYVFKVSVDPRRLPVFAAGAVLGLTVNMGVTLFIAAIGAVPLAAKAAGIATAFLLNYGLNVLIVYRR